VVGRRLRQPARIHDGGGVSRARAEVREDDLDLLGVKTFTKYDRMAIVTDRITT
jgi:hypothetical protein